MKEKYSFMDIVQVIILAVIAILLLIMLILFISPGASPVGY